MCKKMQNKLIVRKFENLCKYQDFFQEMQNFTQTRSEETPDEIWFLEHEHVFTQGKAGKPEHILNPGNVPIIQSDRGGQVTYHGPGQLIIYPLIDLRRKNLGAKKFVHTLEKTVIDVLASYGVTANSREDAPGIYVQNHKNSKCDESKICSLGLHISHGCTYHGLAFNINADLQYFARINPCGYKNLKMSNLTDFVGNIDKNDVQNRILTAFKENFAYDESTSLTETTRKPSWIKSKLISLDNVVDTKKLLQKNHMLTVCDAARCPNKGECFSRKTATFIIMGDICTRNCKFCNVNHGKPLVLDITEPERLAKTISAMGLKYVVITSVCRDDLKDSGAQHFTACIKKIRAEKNAPKIEILAPDFRGYLHESLEILATSPPDVFGHNIETVPRLYKTITPNSNYLWSLNLLKEHKKRFPHIPTKSGIMVGLGEIDAEIISVLKDLREHNVEILTIGQYLQPNKSCREVTRYVTPEKFADLANIAKEIGFRNVVSGPMVRSSYYADSIFV